VTHMLVRNRVEDFERWKVFFDAEDGTAEAAGLKLIKLWRAIEDPNNVFFIFEVASIERATAFLNDPNSAEVGKASGVIDGEYHFANEVSF
jgi:hypothetical protein